LLDGKHRRSGLFDLRELLGVMRLIELPVAARTAASTSALGPATIIAIIELQWTISLVELRTPHTRKRSGEAAAIVRDVVSWGKCNCAGQ
jgi:hypothetical protein